MDYKVGYCFLSNIVTADLSAFHLSDIHQLVRKVIVEGNCPAQVGDWRKWLTCDCWIKVKTAHFILHGIN